jgi:hypothetical protein
VLFCLTLVLGVLLTLTNMLNSLPALQLATLTFLPLLLAAIRGALRVVAVTEAVPSARSQIMGQSWIYIVLGVFIPFLYVLNFIMSLLSRKIRWRGVVYEVISSAQTRILHY